jgi:hypothetical protein
MLLKYLNWRGKEKKKAVRIMCRGLFKKTDILP